MAIITASSKILACVEGFGKVKSGQYGDYQSVLFQRYDIEGDDAKVWKSMKPSDASKFRRGQQVWLIPAKREGGKESWDVELIDPDAPLSSSQPVAPKAAEQPGQYRIADEQKQAIAAYITDMSKLLAFCRTAAQQSLGDVEEETIRASTASLFAATTRKFNL